MSHIASKQACCATYMSISKLTKTIVSSSSYKWLVYWKTIKSNIFRNLYKKLSCFVSIFCFVVIKKLIEKFTDVVGGERNRIDVLWSFHSENFSFRSLILIRSLWFSGIGVMNKGWMWRMKFLILFASFSTMIPREDTENSYFY